MDKMVSHWDDERAIHVEIKNYKEVINNSKIENEEEKFDLNFHTDYIKYIDDATASILELKSKISNNQINI
ncbi:hypothetical protein JCM19314_2156 [Nonlabens ulvanivorans]|nr:hypothetical protein JCM19314_2156 [Nonlabens ulvanivorans]